jgi:hypothetical protein
MRRPEERVKWCFIAVIDGSIYKEWLFSKGRMMRGLIACFVGRCCVALPPPDPD